MSSKSISPQAASSVFDFTVEDVKGKPYPLSKLKDKKALLFVNVASE
jgi:glutathione peroxidase-family protein